MQVTILGCGGSGGVPLADGTPGGFWGACDPNNPKNRRQRVSILVRQVATACLVDTSPDLRQQILAAGIDRLDAVFFTHAHSDHAHGLDDLRALVYRRGVPIDAYMDEKTRDALTRSFGYAFTSSHDPGSLYSALLNDRLIGDGCRIGSIPVTAFVQGHGDDTTLGYRFGSVAYSTDVVSLDATAFAALDGVALWIVDCLRVRPHPTHSWLDRTLDWIARVRPRRAVLTHMNHETDYETLLAACPAGVEPAYDGMTIEIEDSA